MLVKSCRKVLIYNRLIFFLNLECRNIHYFDYLFVKTAKLVCGVPLFVGIYVVYIKHLDLCNHAFQNVRALFITKYN